MTTVANPPARFVTQLQSRVAFHPADIAALNQLTHNQRALRPAQYVVREGQLPQRCGFIVDGYGFRQKLTIDGNREIVAVLVPGDFVDLQNLYFTESDHDVVALTNLTLAEFTLAEICALVAEREGVGRALWITSLIEASISREWLLNLGRRDAKMRLAHLLCELHVRLRAAKVIEDATYELPMTQEQFGDALGLTPVHVNRMFQQLEREGLILRERRRMQVLDWDALREAAEFNPRYLHLSTIAT